MRAQSPDSHNGTAERLLALIWKLTTPSDAHPELLACDAMADVLRQYVLGVGHWLYCKQYLERCCQELAAGPGHNAGTALRVLRRLLALYELFDSEQQRSEMAAGSMEVRGREALGMAGLALMGCVGEVERSGRPAQAGGSGGRRARRARSVAASFRPAATTSRAAAHRARACSQGRRTPPFLRVCDACPPPQGMSGCGAREQALPLVLAELDQKFGLQRQLVDNVLELVQQARRAQPPAPPPAAAGSSGAGAAMAVDGEAAARRPPAHAGSSASHEQILAEYMLTISYVASKSQVSSLFCSFFAPS